MDWQSKPLWAEAGYPQIATSQICWPQQPTIEPKTWWRWASNDCDAHQSQTRCSFGDRAVGHFPTSSRSRPVSSPGGSLPYLLRHQGRRRDREGSWVAARTNSTGRNCHSRHYNKRIGPSWRWLKYWEPSRTTTNVLRSPPRHHSWLSDCCWGNIRTPAWPKPQQRHPDLQ